MSNGILPDYYRNLPPGHDYRLPPDLVVGQEYGLAADVPTNWGMAFMRMDALRKISKGKGVLVGIADTGIDINHEQFASKRIRATRSFLGESVFDGNGHGTHVAGTIMGDDPKIGGSQECEGLIAKVLSNGGSGRSDQIGAGFEWLDKEGCHIISASLGGPSPDQWTEKALRAFVERGGWAIIAAGNERQQGRTVGYPAAYPFCLPVAAVDQNGRYASFSNPGKDNKQLAISAPGVQIVSARSGGGYVLMSGTSMACPMTATAATLYIGSCLSLGIPIPTSEVFRSILFGYALDAGTPGADRDYGPGYMRCDILARQLTPDAPPLAI
jgi:subtilisin